MTIDSVAITKLAVYNSNDNTIRVPSTQSSGSVQLNLPTNTRASRVISCGVPLPESGVSSTSELMLKNELGAEVPAQFDVLTNWPDGSIMWVLVTANVSASNSSEKLYSLDYGFGVSQSVYASNLGYTETSSELTVTTGVSRIVIDKVTGLIKTAHADTAGDQSYVTQVLGQATIFQQDALDSVQYSSSNETAASVSVLRNGPFQILVRASGRTRDVSNNSYTEYRLFYRFYKDTENFDLDYTMIDDADHDNPQSNFPMNAGNTVPFSCRNLGINIPHSISSSPQYIFGGESSNAAGSLTAETYISQTGFRSLNQNGVMSLDPNETDQTIERTDKSGWGQSYSGVQSGSRAKGFATVHNGIAGVSMIQRNFWQEWPNELNITTTDLSFHLHPERYHGGSVVNNHTVVNGLWQIPNTLYHTRRGIAKTFELTVCIHSGTPDAAVIENITDDRINLAPQLRCTPDYYCSCGAWWDLKPEDADSTTYYTGIFNDTLLVSQDLSESRVLPYNWRDFGGTLRLDNESGPPFGYPGAYNGAHIGGVIYTSLYVMTGRQGWLDYSLRESKFFMDLVVNHGQMTNAYAVLNPLPAGQIRAGNHKDVDHDTGYGSDAHAHMSGLADYYWFTGNPRALEVIEEIKAHYTHKVDWNYPDPRPANWTSGRSRALGTRAFTEAERETGWPLFIKNICAKATGDANFHSGTSTKMVKFLLDWWNEPEDHYIDGVIVGASNSVQGTGYWILDETDSVPGSAGRTNTCVPWMSAAIFQAVLDWYELELKFNNSGLDLQEVRNMLYQCCQFVNYWGYIESSSEYGYTAWHTGSNAFPDANGARLLMSPMTRIYKLYKSDLALGRISNPEWFDDATWKSRILLYLNRWRTYSRGSFPPGFYGYEFPFPMNFFKHAAEIETE